MAQAKTSRRAMLGGIAALSAAAAVAAPAASTPAISATSPATSDFDLAYARYKALARADDADAKRGDLRRAYDAYDRETQQLVADHGHRAAMPPEAKEKWEVAWQRMQAAEKTHAERFTEPRWQAASELFATAAPSAEAMLRKLEVAKVEDALPEDVIKFVHADLRRLAA